MVLRHYQRGGLVARLARGTYFFSGLKRTRSFAELQLLARMRSLGLPVPAPIAAAVWRTGPAVYRAAIIVERLEGSQSLGRLIGALDEDDWRDVGRTVRQLHDARVCHADLNCFNILLSENGIHLIDFDKGHLRRDGARWRSANLVRLRRSLEKCHWPAQGPALDEAWAQLLQGYQAPDSETRSRARS